MFNHGVRLALAMKLVVLIALNLAYMRVQPFQFRAGSSPPSLFALVMLNLVIVQSLLLGRPLRAFHYTFLVVGAAQAIALTAFASFNTQSGRGISLCILERLMRRYPEITGINPLVWKPTSLAIADRCLTSALGLLLALAAGLWAKNQARCRPTRPSNTWQRIALFFQGTLIGLGLFTMIVTIHDYFGQEAVGPFIRLLGVAICTFSGGTAVSLLNSLGYPEGRLNRP